MLNTEIYTALNVAGITSLLDARSKTNTAKALINDKVIPATWTARKTINFYLNSPINFCAEFTDEIYSINCRADTLYESQNIALMVANTLNRTSVTGAFFKCTMNAPIAPKDSTDNYNTQIEVTAYYL